MSYQSQETLSLSTDESSSKHNENGSLERSFTDAEPPRQSEAARRSSLLFVENIRKMESRPESPENYSLKRYFNSIINVSPTRTDVQGLIGVPPQSPKVMSEACVQKSRAQADEPEQCLQTVDCSVAKDDRRSERKRKHVPSPSSSSSVCSENDEVSKMPPLISRDLWTSTGPRKSLEPRSRAKNHALSKSPHSINAKYKHFMKEVFPELVKKSPWTWSRHSATPDSSKPLQISTPRKSPLAETTEERLGRPSAHREEVPAEKSFWSVPKPLNTRGSETDKNAGPAGTSEFNGTRVLKYRIGLRQKDAEVPKRPKKSRHDAVLSVVGKERPVRRETLKNVGAAEEPCETQKNESRTSEPSSGRDSPIETVKPRCNFWQNPRRSSNKNAWRDTSPVAALKFANKKTPPQVPETGTLLNKTSGEEDKDAWIWYPLKQRQDALAKAAAARSTKAASATRPSHNTSKLPVLDRHRKEHGEPPKGTKDAASQTSGLHFENKASVALTSVLQHDTKDADAQTSFVCMVGKSIRMDRTARKRLRGAFHTTEEELQFMDLPIGQAGGVSGITFGNFLSTRTAAIGVMRLGPNSEKPLSANNENDMFLYALDSGVNITTLGGTWLILRKGSDILHLPRIAFYTEKSGRDNVQDPLCIHRAVRAGYSVFGYHKNEMNRAARERRRECPLDQLRVSAPFEALISGCTTEGGEKVGAKCLRV
ncbi:hypothetical protein MTO96_024108 [Rhipicephalus appendiculatus]